jgi:uncharacterized protein
MPHFEWDENKAQSNLKKHGIGFEEASLVFDNPLAVIFLDDQHSDFETREILMGHTKNGVLLLVSFVERELGIVRIISARVATKKEEVMYVEHLG